MTPIESIVLWVRDKPKWWQYAVTLSLKNSGTYKHRYEDIYMFALYENDICSTEDDICDSIDLDVVGYSEEQTVVALESIRNISNIGALDEDQVLRFSTSGMNIVYGDNGSGKSSYARVIKRMCLSRGDSPQIIGNIYKQKSSSSAVLDILSGGNKVEYEWTDKSVSNEYLKSIRVFDHIAADHFTAKEDELGFKPYGLYVLDDLSDVVRYVKARVDEEIQPGNGLRQLPSFSNSDVGAMIRNLSYLNDEDSIKSLCSTSTDTDRLSVLLRDIEEFKSKSLRQAIKEKSNDYDIVTVLCNHLKRLHEITTNSKINHISKLIVKLKAKMLIQKDLIESKKEKLYYEQVGSKAWTDIWDASKLFLLTHNNSCIFTFAPREVCPLCIQTISDEASTALTPYIKMIQDNSYDDVKCIEKELYEIKHKLINTRLDFDLFQSSIDVAEKYAPNIKSDIELFIDSIKKVIGNILLAIDKRDTGFITFQSIPLPVNDVIISHIDKQIKELSSVEKYNDVIRSREDEVNRVNDKIILSKCIDDVLSNLKRYKDVERYNILRKQCDSRAITNVSSEI